MTMIDNSKARNDMKLNQLVNPDDLQAAINDKLISIRGFNPARAAKSSRPMTEEQRAASAARLAAMRDAVSS